MKNLLIVVLVLSGLTTAWAQRGEVATIEVTEVATAMEEGAVFVDVRETPELAQLTYDVNHVIHIPLSEFPNRRREIAPDQLVILACRSGRRSVQAAKLLQEIGHQKVSSLAGGIIAWEAAGLPVSKGAFPKNNGTSPVPMQCGGNKGKGKGKAAGCCGKESSSPTSSCGKKSKGQNTGCCSGKSS